MNDFDELKELDLATVFLADKLSEGTLVLFLGAGASKGFGLPDWKELVNELRARTGLKLIDSFRGPEDLQRAADDVLEKLGSESNLIELIRDVLYPGVKVSDSLTTLFTNPLLLGVAAMLMGSKRGHINRVVTLNYDNLLQSFLSIYGFSVKTVYSLPELEGSEDVRIYHPHGFIPMPGHQPSSNFVILGLASANKRLGTTGDAWFEMVRHILDSGICLFIGMSPDTLSDRALSPLFSTCGPKCNHLRPLGFWTVLDNIDESKEGEYRRNNIIPLKMSTPNEIAHFLFEICKKSGEKLNK